MSFKMLHVTIFSFLMFHVFANIGAIPFPSTDSSMENLNEGNNGDDCKGKPFGSPCSFVEEIEHPTGYCDNNICTIIPTALNDGECDEEEFTCGNGECIDLEWKCDGENDCYGDEDEELCNDS